MKLKEDCFIQVVDDVQYLMPGGDEAPGSALQSNRTAALIVALLGEETTEEEIVDTLFARFDAPREEIAADVREVLDTLRGVGAIEEE